ncbi:hypothetical protein A3K82_01735 [Candidatus Pacearchaeota archaeon RBG_19FT_COMBO_34_9]|nr:MAG: hypothetical protein A3K82_01735 [Candidatus Pacearchaeota archaeon RBG_19FT_COMBO_34_9]OGJ16702.1 MAG: hypothetical protein A3K74_00610 [Candidatus Pacearchaeota archaeon RBG_13_33_26]
MKNKRLIYLSIGLILIIGIFAINASVNKTKQWHSDINIKILVDGSEKTLQEAINGNLLAKGGLTPGWYDNKTKLIIMSADCGNCEAICSAIGSRSEGWYASCPGMSRLIRYDSCNTAPTIEPYCIPTIKYNISSSIPTGGHNADSIWVSVNGAENTLLNALKTTGLYGNTTTLSYNGPADKSKAYHYATEIEITVCGNKTSLQEAIDTGKFTKYVWSNGTCSVTCGGGTKIVSCQRESDGMQVANACCDSGTKPSTVCNPQACAWHLTSTSCCSGGLSCYKTCISAIQNPPYASCSSQGLSEGAACSSRGTTKTCYPGGGSGAGCCWAYTYICQ